MNEEGYFDWTNEVFDLKKVFEKPEALKGIRVLELATLYLGPATSCYLAEYGAEVIKVELPGAGDTARYVAYEGYYWKNISAAMMLQNRNKYHVAINVHHPEGKELFLRLAARSDVVVENLRAGTMDRWGLGYRQLRTINPDLIYAANNGFGQWGPYSVGRASYDVLAQGVSGIASITGFPGRPPQKIGFWVGDWLGAALSATAILVALHHRARTGQGQFIELSQAEGLIRSLDWTWLYLHLTGQERGQYGNRDVALGISDIVPCRDGFVAITAFTDEEFRGLCAAMGQPELADDPRFKDHQTRLQEENASAFLKLMAAWAASRTRQELDQLGTKYGFASAPVLDFKEQYEDEHFRARGAVWELDDPLYGQVVEPGPVPRMSETPGRLKWSAKPVGFHNEYVFSHILGLSPSQIRELEEKGVVGKWADRLGAKPPDDWDGRQGLIFPQAAMAGRSDEEIPGQLELTCLDKVREVGQDTRWEEWVREQDDPRQAHERPEALDDLMVLDTSYGNVGGLVCSSVLSEFGAEVIRLEPPGGDIAREFTPFGLKHRDTGLAYLVEGRNKFHITLNLETEEGREIFKRLARKADIVIETFKPGQMDAWGIGYRGLRKVNPGLIYLALHVYGQFGPRASCGKPDYDVINQALSGSVWSTGEMEDPEAPKPYQVPTKAGCWYGWFSGGIWAAFGILAALHYREETGKGQMIDVSGAEAIMRFLDYYLTLYHQSGMIKGRVGPLDPAVFPYTFIRCKDGYTVMVGFSDVNFHAVTEVMGRPELREDPRFDSPLKRAKLENEKVLHAILEDWARDYTAAEILEKAQDYILNKRGPGVLATGRINSPRELLEEDNWWERGIFERFEDPIYGELLLQMPVWKMTETPPRIKWACHPVGYDNAFIYLKYLGYGKGRLEELRRKGVI